MGGVVSGITDAVGLTDTKDAGDKAYKASKMSVDAQKEALEYIKQREALPQALREEALTKIGGFYGLGDGTDSQQELIDQAMRTPIYQAIQGTKAGAEEAILRNAAATGGLRSGNVQDALARLSQDIDESALLTAYNQQLQGLTGLANLPSMSRDIAGMIQGIGATKAQGLVDRSQANIAAENQLWSDITGLGKMGFTAAGMGGYGI